MKDTFTIYKFNTNEKLLITIIKIIINIMYIITYIITYISYIIFIYIKFIIVY